MKAHELTYPDLGTVRESSQRRLAVWFRFLSKPKTDSEKLIYSEIKVSLEMKGGITEEISREIGWDPYDIML